MQIQLTKDDIDAAIRSHIRNMGIVGEVQSIVLNQTKKPPSYKVTVEIGLPSSSVAPTNTAHQGTADLRPAGNINNKPADDVVSSSNAAADDTAPVVGNHSTPDLKVVENETQNADVNSAGEAEAEEETPPQQPKRKLFSQ